MGKHLRHLLQFSRVYTRWVGAGHLGSCRLVALHPGEVELAVIIALVTAAGSGVVIVLVTTASGTTTTRSPLLVILIVRLLVVLEPAFIIVRVLLGRRSSTRIFVLILLWLSLVLILLTIIVGLLYKALWLCGTNGPKVCVREGIFTVIIENRLVTLHLRLWSLGLGRLVPTT